MNNLSYLKERKNKNDPQTATSVFSVYSRMLALQQKDAYRSLQLVYLYTAKGHQGEEDSHMTTDYSQCVR